MIRRPPRSPLFPYPTLFRSCAREAWRSVARGDDDLGLPSGQLQQPAAARPPQVATPRAGDSQADRRDEPQGAHDRAARAVLQGRRRQGRDRPRQGKAAARQARGSEAPRRRAGARPPSAGPARMIPLACLLLLLAPPQTVVIATPRGLTSVPITMERGSSAVAAPLLAGPLGLTVAIEGSRATVSLGGTLFVFQLAAPFVRAGHAVYGLVGEPYVARDTLFLPLHWLADCLPRALGARYHWNAAATRLDELPVAGAVVAGAPPRPPAAPPPPPPPPPGAPPPGGAPRGRRGGGPPPPGRATP